MSLRASKNLRRSENDDENDVMDDDDYVEDDVDFIDQDEVEEMRLSANPFKIVLKEDVLKEIQERIESTVSLTGLCRADATLLLRSFKWNYDSIAEKYFQNETEYNKAAQIHPLAPNDKPQSPTPLECLVCLETVPSKNTFALSCRHYYCNDCWKGYLEEQIISYGPNTIATRCMAPKCLQVVPQELFKKLLTPEKFEKYSYFFLKSCVEQNPKFTFCPKDCGTIVQYLNYGRPKQSVSCSCGTFFCFSCGQERHNPASCTELTNWLSKESSQEDAVKLIEATAKQCPHCNQFVTRNDGCNHMRCRCGKDWCWMCRKDWAPHGSSWYNCFQYEKSDAKQKDESSATVKQELDRYMTFYQRFQDHQSTGRDAEKRRAVINKKSLEYQQKTNFDPSFLSEALDLLISCRHTLKYFYVYQFNHDKETTSGLTVEQRNLAEHFTELLADFLFVDLEKLDRDKLKNHITVTKKYMKGLVESLEEKCDWI